MTSKVQISPATRRQTVPLNNQKRRKPRRQSGHAVEAESKESIVQKALLQRTDSDKVIRRNSMERKMSTRNSVKLPEDFLKGLRGLDDSLTRMSIMSQSRRGSANFNDSKGSLMADNSSASNDLKHGPEFTDEQLAKMSRQALQFSDSEDESEVSVELDVKVELIDV